MTQGIHLSQNNSITWFISVDCRKEQYREPWLLTLWAPYKAHSSLCFSFWI